MATASIAWQLRLLPCGQHLARPETRIAAQVAQRINLVRSAPSVNIYQGMSTATADWIVLPSVVAHDFQSKAGRKRRVQKSHGSSTSPENLMR